jgi:methylmalonyl-CoA mutase cobalamin-binding domain/chain
LTDVTVQALATLAGLRDAGALVHSYLDDGPAMQLSHYGAYVGWAALELYVVEELLGGRLAHVLEVHDVVRDVLASALPAAGAEVIVLPSHVSAAEVAQVTADEDADAIVIGTYNGVALTLARELTGALRDLGHHPAVIFGGRLNEDLGEGLPSDVRALLKALGVRGVDRLEDLAPLLATANLGAGRQPSRKPASAATSASGASSAM